MTHAFTMQPHREPTLELDRPRQGQSHHSIPMDAGLVSVVIPTFNRAYCLARTLDSVFAQTYPDVEVLLVDDGSTDGTRSLVESRWGRDSRLRYLYQPNRGVSAARNLGLQNARGEFIALLDSDDVWMEWKLEAQVACLSAFPEAGMVWSDMQAVDPEGHVLDPMHLRKMYNAYDWFAPTALFEVERPITALMERVPQALRTAVVRYGDIFSPMVMGNLVHTSTVVLRRSRLAEVRSFDESMRTGEDYDFHLRTCRAGPVAFLEAASIRYQLGRPDQLSKPGMEAQIARNFLRTIEPIVKRDRARITLPDWMIARSLAFGHLWLGECALRTGHNAEARVHLAASLRFYPRQPRAAMLLAVALPPPGASRALLRGLHRIKRALRGSSGALAVRTDAAARASAAAATNVAPVEGALEVTLGPMPPFATLATEWRDLEERSEASFFLSWTWIGCWIATLDGAAELKLLRATLSGRTVGLAVLAPLHERRHRVIGSRTLRLHATGQSEFDILKVECNGLLVERSHSASVTNRMYEHLLRERSWDELMLDGLWHMPELPESAAALRVRVSTSASHFVALGAVRERGGDYLGLLGSKTRSRIRRSLKEYERLGAVTARAAVDVTEALAFLEGLKGLHQSYWMARREPGAFANRFFEQFHTRLVRESFDHGEAQLIAIDAGEVRLGYIYNFVYRGRVYNYQSGFNYGVVEKHNRPGLVAHARAIELNARSGHDIYDFLAGDVEYKRALGTGSAPMVWVVVQRHRLRFRIEDAGRVLRRRVRRLRSSAVPHAPGPPPDLGHGQDAGPGSCGQAIV